MHGIFRKQMAYLQEQTLVAFVETMLFLEVDPWNGQEELQPYESGNLNC